MFDEQRYFARGDQVRAFDAPFGRASLLVCEDLWHPSTVYLAALDRALFVICPSSSPLRGISDGEVQDDNARYWELINRSYAETFGLFVIYANRVGFEDGVGFWGGSEILDPFGRRLAKGRYYEEDFITAELSLDLVRRKRVASPLLRDEDLDLTIKRADADSRKMNSGTRVGRGKGTNEGVVDSGNFFLFILFPLSFILFFSLTLA